MFEEILNEIKEVDKLEAESWSVFTKPSANPIEMQVAVFNIQWCINRRTAAFNAISNIAQLGLQAQQSERKVLSPR
jgi:hypothetical protein